MKFFVKAEVFETIINPSDINRIRMNLVKHIKIIKGSKKFIDGGVLSDSRAMYFIFDIEKTIDLYELLGSGILDGFKIETHPVATFEELEEFFKKDIIA